MIDFSLDEIMELARLADQHREFMAEKREASEPDGDVQADCRCRHCIRHRDGAWALAQTFVVCSQCGNKRCPKADDHHLECSGSNEPGQQPNRPSHDGEPRSS